MADVARAPRLSGRSIASASSTSRAPATASRVGPRRRAPSPTSTSRVPAPVRAAASTATAAARPWLGPRSVPVARIAGINRRLAATATTPADVTASASATAASGAGGRNLDGDPAAIGADMRAPAGPAGQRLHRRALGVPPGGSGERPRLRRPVGDRHRVPDEQQLQRERGRQRQRGQRRQQLDRGLPRPRPPTRHHPHRSVEAADTDGIEMPGMIAGTLTFTLTPSPERIAAPSRSAPGSAWRAAASASEPTSSARAPARAALPADQSAQPTSAVCAAIARQTAIAGQHGDQLDRRLSRLRRPSSRVSATWAEPRPGLVTRFAPSAANQ